MAVGAIAERPARDAPEADAVVLEPLAVRVLARVHEVRRVGEAGRAHVLRLALAQQA